MHNNDPTKKFTLIPTPTKFPHIEDMSQIVDALAGIADHALAMVAEFRATFEAHASFPECMIYEGGSLHLLEGAAVVGQHPPTVSFTRQFASLRPRPSCSTPARCSPTSRSRNATCRGGRSRATSAGATSKVPTCGVPSRGVPTSGMRRCGVSMRAGPTSAARASLAWLCTAPRSGTPTASTRGWRVCSAGQPRIGPRWRRTGTGYRASNKGPDLDQRLSARGAIGSHPCQRGCVKNNIETRNRGQTRKLRI